MTPEPDTLAVVRELVTEHDMGQAEAAATVTAVVRLTEHLASSAAVAVVDEKVERLDEKVERLDERIDGLRWWFLGTAVALVTATAAIFGLGLAIAG